MAYSSDRKIRRLKRELEAAEAERRKRVYKWYVNHGALSAAERFKVSRQRIMDMVVRERARMKAEAAKEGGHGE